MKIKFNLLIVAKILIAVSFVQWSCSSPKRSAVSCPDFSHSRNMKSRHAQLRSAYPDQQGRYRNIPAWDRQSWYRSSSKKSEGENLTAGLYIVPESGQPGIVHNGDKILLTCIQPVRAQLASMVIPIERIQTSASANPGDMPASTKRTEAGVPGCDTIVLRNGDIMEAKVVEIGQHEIRYKKCENTEGPVFVVNITDVFMIKYPNGTRDYFTSERSPAPSMGGTAQKKTDGMAVAGFIGSLVGLFIAGIPLGIMAIVFGFVSLGKIKRHPERYKGRGFGIASIIIGAVDVIGMLIILAAS
jgi:hypothetical protein